MYIYVFDIFFTKLELFIFLQLSSMYLFFTQFLTVFAAACEASLVFDVEMESVIALTSVLCNTGAPPPPGLSGGAARVTNP